MKWLPAIAIAIIIIAIVALGQMFLAIRDLEKQERELYGQVNSLGAQYDELQKELLRLVELPKPQLVTLKTAHMDFAAFVDDLRKAGIRVTEISPPKVVEQPGTETLEEEPESKPSEAGFDKVVGTVKIGASQSFDEVLDLLSALQNDPRLLTFSKIEAKAGRQAGEYVLTIEVIYAVEREVGGE